MKKTAHKSFAVMSDRERKAHLAKLAKRRDNSFVLGMACLILASLLIAIK